MMILGGILASFFLYIVIYMLYCFLYTVLCTTFISLILVTGVPVSIGWVGCWLLVRIHGYVLCLYLNIYYTVICQLTYK